MIISRISEQIKRWLVVSSPREFRPVASIVPILREPRHDQWGGDNWKVLRDTPFVENDQADFRLIAPKDMEKNRGDLIVLEYDDHRERFNKYWNSKAIIRRAKKKGGLTGLRHAEFLIRNQQTKILVQNQTRIPEEWREFCLFFPGTVRRYGDGLLRIPFLFWNGVEWRLSWSRLTGVPCSVNDRIVRLRA